MYSICSNYVIGIFRSLRWYLQITPLVSSDHSSDYPFCIISLPPLVYSDKLFVIF